MSLTELRTRLHALGYENSEDYLAALDRGHQLRKATEVIELHCRVGSGSILSEVSFVQDGQAHLIRLLDVCQN